MLSRGTSIGRCGILIAGGLGVLVAGNRTLRDLIIGDVCPDLGPVPVCGIILLSYAAILGYGLLYQRVSKALFYVGGFPAITGPALGSLREIQSPNFCQSTLHSSVPDCFVLLSVSILAVLCFVWINTGQGVDRGSVP